MKIIVRAALGLTLLLVLACGEDENILKVEIVASIGTGRDIEMVEMPGGSFEMGSDFLPVLIIDTVLWDPLTQELIMDTVVNVERPIHVALLSPFMISSTEITQEQYQAVMNLNPSRFKSVANQPVENVSWFDAAAFCNKLSDMLGYEQCYDNDFNCDFTANGFRLPTETEWEYAARAGYSHEFFFSRDSSDLGVYAWYSGNSGSATHEVATRDPSPYGLYDIHGNVTEWCQDWYNYYNCNAESNPDGPETGVYKVARGGSWAGTWIDCRTAYRVAYEPTKIVSTLGFRIVRRR